MNQIFDNSTWDSFNDKLILKVYNLQGKALLGRWYKKNGFSIYKHIKYTEDETDVVALPVVAKGNTAFLADESITLFRCSLHDTGLNYGVDLERFFETYFNHNISFLRLRNQESTPFKNERKTYLKLIKEHLKEEQRLIGESKLFFDEIILDEKINIETIKKAVNKYQTWLKNNIKQEILKKREINIFKISEQTKKIEIQPDMFTKDELKGIVDNINVEIVFKMRDHFKLIFNKLNEYKKLRNTDNKDFAAIAFILYEYYKPANMKSFKTWLFFIAKECSRICSYYQPAKLSDKIEEHKREAYCNFELIQ